MHQPAELSKSRVWALGYRLALCAVGLVALVIAPACQSPDAVALPTSSVARSETAQAEHRVIIQSMSFLPAEINIRVGESVTWVNEDTTAHTVTSWSQYQNAEMVHYTDVGKLWDSGDISPGQSFTRTFSQPGTFEYISLPLYFYMTYGHRAVGVVLVSE